MYKADAKRAVINCKPPIANSNTVGKLNSAIKINVHTNRKSDLKIELKTNSFRVLVLFIKKLRILIINKALPIQMKGISTARYIVAGPSKESLKTLAIAGRKIAGSISFSLKLTAI